MIAANLGFVDVAGLLLGNGANVNRQVVQYSGTAGGGWSALHYASGAGHQDMAEYLLDQGADVGAKWSWGRSVLFEASFYAHWETVELLLSRGADVGEADAEGLTPLHAVGYGEGALFPSGELRRSAADGARVVALLLDAGADVNARGLTSGRKSPLDVAVSRHRLSQSATLRAAGGYCYVQTSSLCAYPPVVTAVTLAVTTTVTSETVCESGSLSANGQTQAQLDAGLVSAAEGNDLTSACDYLRRGADVETREATPFYGGHRRTPLMIAANLGFVDVAGLLLGNGANVNRQVVQYSGTAGGGWSALHYASGAGHQDMAEYLLDQGADVGAKWSWGRSVLFEASFYAHWETVELLLSRGADVGEADAEGLTPLHAVGYGEGALFPSGELRRSAADGARVVALLLDAGADVNARGLTSGRKSPLDVAVSRHRLSQSATLRAAGGYCYVQTSSLCAYPPVAEADSLECPAGTLPTNGLTAAELNMTLRMAARGGDATRACEALRRGAEVNDNLDDSEFTPLQEAVSGGHLEAAKVLLANGAEVNKRKGGAGHSPLDLAARDGEAEIAALLRNADGRCFLETGPLCQSVPMATPGPVTVVNTVATTVVATVANTVVAAVENTVASTVAAGSCPAGTLPTNGMMQAELDYEFLGAVLENDLEGACEYLRQGANIEIREDEVGRPHNLSALMIAAGRGGYNYPDMTRLLLANGAKTDARDGSGWVTALHYAAASGHTETAALILDWGGDVNVLSSAGDPPLYQAAHWGRADMVQLLLSRGADPDIQADTGVSPLHGAASNVARSGSAAVVSLLLSYDADPNLRRSLPNPGLITRAGETGHSPLDDLVARGYGNYAEAARILRDAGGKCFVRTSSLCQNVPVATPDPVTVVNTVAATVANTIVATVANTVVAAVENTVASTVAAGSCPAGTLDADGMTQAQLDAGLLSAASSGDLAEACKHLRRGANPNGRDQYEHVPLMRASSQADLEMGKLLLDNGAGPDCGVGYGGEVDALVCPVQWRVYFSAAGGANRVLFVSRGGSEFWFQRIGIRCTRRLITTSGAPLNCCWTPGRTRTFKPRGRAGATGRPCIMSLTERAAARRWR